MRALSIRQPYAELLLRGIKTIEYRSRATRIIGERFWIYAAGKWPRKAGKAVRLLRKVDRTMRHIELSSGDDHFVIGCVTNSEMKLLSKHTDLSFAELDNLSF